MHCNFEGPNISVAGCTSKDEEEADLEAKQISMWYFC